MRNLRRHLRQLQAYLDTAIEDMEAGQWEGIVGALLYPRPPAKAGTLAMIEAVAGEQAVQVTWYDEWTGSCNLRRRSRVRGVWTTRSWM
jgi:hypothetical protein